MWEEVRESPFGDASPVGVVLSENALLENRPTGDMLSATMVPPVFARARPLLPAFLPSEAMPCTSPPMGPPSSDFVERWTTGPVAV